MTTVSNTYNKMLSDGKEDFERVGWGSVESQQKRFLVLSEIADLSNSSILDVGCGLGAFYDYLLEIHPKVNYAGTDINHNMVIGALERHPDISFIHADIVTQSEKLKNKMFDYVFLSGALNLSEDKHEDIIGEVMRSMFSLANKGVGINFLSIFSDYFSPGEYYCNPEKILKLAFSITSKVALRHDYMPHDFTVYLYK